jgi:hypothetical protein
VPRTKYARPPGPFPPIEKIKRSKFEFRSEQRRKLTKLLPPSLACLGAPPDLLEKLPKKTRTIADLIVQATEEAMGSYLTTFETRLNPANVRAAIHRLRADLKPFVLGWVDDETAEIVPVDLDSKLAARDQEISKQRLASAKQRYLAMLCQWIEVVVRQIASANGQTLNQQEMLLYIDKALKFARIDHPDIRKHRARLAALTFPKETSPQIEG